MNCVGLGILLAVASVGEPAISPADTTDWALEMLAESAKDSNPDVRKETAIALSLCGPREPFLSDLEALLKDKDVQVQVAAAASLADLHSKRVVAALRKALQDDVPEVSFAAAKALWALHDPEGKQALLAVLGGEMKTSSGFFTRQKRDALRMVHTPQKMAMFALRQGVGFAPVPGLGEGIASMQGLLSDANFSGRAVAALLLGSQKDEATLRALRDALSDKESSVRAAAVHSLALRNDPAVQPDIVPLLDDKNGRVRLRAAAAYLRLDIVKRSQRRMTKAAAPAAK